MRVVVRHDGKRQIILSPNEAADMMSCLSVCAWIRSEQLTNPDRVLQVVEVDTHDLHTAYCRSQLSAATFLYQRLGELLGPGVHLPSWQKKNGAP